MDRRVKDLTGKVFRLLTVVEYAGVDKRRNALWLCRCECGGSRVVRSDRLRRGLVSHCGCRKAKSHNMAGTPTYRAWVNMRVGTVDVCEHWVSFMAFYRAMGERPDGAVLCRNDLDAAYSPENCCWGTSEERQRQIEQHFKRITHDGKTLLLREWAAIAGIAVELLRLRLHNGWSVERALQSKIETRTSRRKKCDCTPNLYRPWDPDAATSMSNEEVEACIQSM